MTACVISVEGLVQAYLYRAQHKQDLESAIIWLPQAADSDPDHAYLQKRLFSTLRQKNYSVESANKKAAEIIGLVGVVSRNGRYVRRALKEPLNIAHLAQKLFIKFPTDNSQMATLAEAASTLPRYNPWITQVFY